MFTPVFNPRPDVFSDNEKTFLREMVQRLDEACQNCNKCDECIFARFCNEKDNSPSDMLDEIISILGVSKD